MVEATRCTKVIDANHQLEQQPFRPFRICISDGTEYTVYNPKFVLLTHRTLHIGVPEDAEDVPHHVKLHDAMHITRVEPIEQEPGG